jgi:septum formation protein
MRLTDLNILLASSSPRRREILSMVGVKFRVVKARSEEKFYSTP